MKRKWIPIIILLVVALTVPAFAITQQIEVELQNATPGTRKANLGNLIRAKYATGVEFSTTGDSAVDLFQEPSGDTGYVRKFTGVDGEATTLGDGREGQVVTFALTYQSTAGMPWTITPSTSSGFRATILTTAGEAVTLKYIDDTVGWVYVGYQTSDAGRVTIPVTNNSYK